MDQPISPLQFAVSKAPLLPAGRPKARWRRWLPVVMVAAAMIVVLTAGWHQHLTLENISLHRDRFRSLINGQRPLAVLVYVLAYTSIVSLSLPSAGLLTLTGGLLFGWLVGGLAAVLAATLGASVLFLITRQAAGDALAAGLGPIVTKLQTGFRQDALNYMLFLRLVPIIPFCVVNVVPALIGVPFATFFFGTLIGIVPGTFAVSMAGAGLDGVIAMAKTEQAACLATLAAAQCPLSIHLSSIVTPQLNIAIAMFSVLAFVPVAVKHWRSRHGG